MKHLQHLAPELFAQLERADETKLRTVCLRVCEVVLTSNELADSLIHDALALLTLGQAYPQDLSDRLDGMVNALDDQYFDLKDRAESEEDGLRQELTAQYRKLFGKARAVAALRFAGDNNAFEAATESIYEAAASMPTKTEIFDLAGRFLAS